MPSRVIRSDSLANRCFFRRDERVTDRDSVPWKSNNESETTGSNYVHGLSCRDDSE